MSTLTIAILGLGRTGASVGLSLRRYMAKGGKFKFEITGHDISTDAEKRAHKMGAIDTIEHRLHAAVTGKDIIIMAMPYEDVRDTYRHIGQDLRQGAVVLDASPLKQPSLTWAAEYLQEDHHVVGITPIFNPRHMFNGNEDTEQADEDLFDDSTFLLTPSASCIKAAVDLAYNFAAILGAKPRFMDPADHDAMIAYTDALPVAAGVALYHALNTRADWNDLQWLTNPAFAVLTRPLYQVHPDALRDQLMLNRESVTRALDEMIASMQSMRAVIAEDDRDAVEALLVSSADSYEKWINRRHRQDWSKVDESNKVDMGGSMMSSLLGKSLADRLTGGKKKDT